MIKRIALIAAIALFMLIATAKAATLTGNVSFVVNNANGTNINYALYNVTSTTGTVTLFNPGTDRWDNNGGGVWTEEDVFPLAAVTNDSQYCIKISGNWINITNSTGYLKASLYDSNFWAYVNSTGADIRITNQSSQLYFWIQDFNATTKTATIWVNLTAGSTELDIFYGNPSALPSSYNNGSKVFKFFDDFSGTALDSKWKIYGTPTISVSSSILEVSGGSSTSPYAVYSAINFTPPFIMYYKAAHTALSLIGWEDPSNLATYTGTIDWHTAAATNEWKFAVGTGTAWNYVVLGTIDTSWHIDAMKITSSGASLWRNWVLKATIAQTQAITSGALDFRVWGGTVYCDWIFVASLADPATFGTPYHINVATLNATASINGVNLVAPVLNATVPSQTFALPALAATNWFNFSAEQGQFSANVAFSFTSIFTQTVTANFTELVVSTSVYVPANCTSNTLTISFNTSTVPSGVAIYTYNLSVLVDGSEVSFTKTATENLNIWYITVTTTGLKQGWHTVKVLLVYQPAYLNITVYDANNVTTLLDKTLNVTVYDSNFNVLASATVNKTANISVVFAGKVFVRISNGIGVARQLETEISPGNTTDLTFYFPTQNVVLATIQLVDYTNSFSNTTVMIKRYITRNNRVVVDVQKVSANLQTSHYLIANVPYEVYITNGIDTRDLGYISVAYSQTITLYIGNILNINAYPYVGVAFSINRTNNSIIIEYKTEHGTTSSVNVVITNSTGYEVFNTTLTTQEGKVVYLINNTNETYYVSFHAENTFSPVTYRTIVSSAYTFSPVLPTLAGGSTLAVALPTLPGWMRALFFGGLVIFTALLFRRQFVPIGLTVSLAVLALFILTSVLKLSTNLLYVLATIVMIAWFAWWRMRR